MTQASTVRAFYESRVGDFAEPCPLHGSGPLRLLQGPDDCVRVPAAVLEAVGFYVVNVQQQENGLVYAIQGNTAGVQTYGVLATSDGSSCHLEVYDPEGVLLGAGIPDWMAATIDWRDREAVRRHAAM